MKKRIKWTLGLTMPAVAALAVCLLLIPTVQASAASDCFCFGLNKNKTFTGTSTADCHWAKIDAYQQAATWASCYVDGYCVEQYQENGCALGVAPFNFSLDFTWKCRLCI